MHQSQQRLSGTSQRHPTNRYLSHNAAMMERMRAQRSLNASSSAIQTPAYRHKPKRPHGSVPSEGGGFCPTHSSAARVPHKGDKPKRARHGAQVINDIPIISEGGGFSPDKPTELDPKKKGRLLPPT